MTGVSPCPYLPGKTERKVFANLPFAGGPAVNDRLTQAGFRRSQNIAYRPACDDCAACVSVRVPVEEVVFSKSQKRTLARITVPDAESSVEDLVERLMGKRADARFQFIQENAQFVKEELDV